MNQVIDSAGTRSRIVVVGAGYAGYHCVRGQILAARAGLDHARQCHCGHATPRSCPVTITGPAVGRLAALVDSLPVSPLNNEPVSCPGASEVSLQLAFRTRTGGPVVALVQTDQACGMVDFTVTGRQRLGLENNPSVDRQILAIASLPWKLPNPLPARRTTRSVLGWQPRRSNRRPVRSAVLGRAGRPAPLTKRGHLDCPGRWRPRSR